MNLAEAQRQHYNLESGLPHPFPTIIVGSRIARVSTVVIHPWAPPTFTSNIEGLRIAG